MTQSQMFGDWGGGGGGGGTYPPMWCGFSAGEGSKLVTPGMEVGSDRNVFTCIQDVRPAVVLWLFKRVRCPRQLGGTTQSLREGGQ